MAFLGLYKYSEVPLIENFDFSRGNVVFTVGIFCMCIGKRFAIDDSTSATQSDFSWTSWFGETLTLTTIGLGTELGLDLESDFRRLGSDLGSELLAFDHENEFKLLFIIISSLLSFLLRGRIWGYVTLAGIQVVIAVLFVGCNAFCLVEIILEYFSICFVSEKALEKIVRHRLERVGEKIRMHDKKIKWMFKRKRIRRRLRRVLGKVLKNQKAP